MVAEVEAVVVEVVVVALGVVVAEIVAIARTENPSCRLYIYDIGSYRKNT